MSAVEIDAPGRGEELLRLLGATAVVALSSWIGLVMIRPDGVSPFWPANGVLLAFLMITPRGRWGLYLASGVAANLLTHVIRGYTLQATVGVSVGNAIEILIAAWPFRHDAPARPDLTRASSLWRFALFGGVLGPAASGLWTISTTGGFLSFISVATKFRYWFVGDSLGILLLTPLMLALLDPDVVQLFAWRKLPETIGLLFLLFGTTTFVFRTDDFPFAFLILVVLIPVIFRMGLSGSAIGVLLISPPATHYTFAGHGPFARPNSQYWGLLLQMFFVTLLAMVYVLSAVRAEERRLAEELRRSETRYRVLAETSRDLILRTTLDGVRTYVSPSIEQVTGWTEEELPPPDKLAVLIHPADREKFEGFLQRLRSKPGSHSLVYRARKRDGRYGWLEAYVGAIFNRASVPDELVWTIRDISARVAQEELLKLEKRQAQKLAWTDGLTGLNNRRAFDERLSEEWSRLQETGESLSLLLLDVDHFKSFNDNYGHQSGDECLRQIAGVIGECIRHTGDFAARYGGEEFAVVLPRAEMARAQEIAERIRARVLDHQMDHIGSATGKVTLSVGAASTGNRSHPGAGELLAAADRALYVAKGSGRNRVVLSA